MHTAGRRRNYREGPGVEEAQEFVNPRGRDVMCTWDMACKKQNTVWVCLVSVRVCAHLRTHTCKKQNTEVCVLEPVSSLLTVLGGSTDKNTQHSTIITVGIPLGVLGPNGT